MMLPDLDSLMENLEFNNVNAQQVPTYHGIAELGDEKRRVHF